MCVVFFSGCAIKPEEKTIFAMDTVMTLKAYGKNAVAAVEEAQEKLYELDGLLDRCDGEISKLNFVCETEVSDTTAEVVEKALEMCEQTDGAFDITLSPITDKWGFYDKKYNVPTKEELDALLEFTGYKNIEINGNILHSNNGATIDLGGIAKGYASDCVADIFRKHGIKSGIVSLGGNVETIGKRPDGKKWSVAIQSPDNAEEYIGIVKSQDNAVITSGDYQRYFEENGQKYHHIINPENGYPVKNGLRSVTVVCKDAARGDALSTALFVMGFEKGREYWKSNSDFGVIFVTDNGEILVTEDVEFESSREYMVIKKHSDM